MSNTLPRVMSLVLLIGCCRPVSGADVERAVQLRDGDRVVLLGGTIIEREQRFGHWETMLTIAHADKHLTFRNLGWSGDTVWGESRGLFEPHLGYQRLVEQVTAVNPTLVLVAYGGNEAFNGVEGLDAFLAQYTKLLDDVSAEGRRFILLCPLSLDAPSLPHDPDVAADFALTRHANVDRYSEAIISLAHSRGHGVIDLRPEHRRFLDESRSPLTFNGLTLSDAGYRQTGEWLTARLSSHVPSNLDTHAAQRLRAAIIAKNELFFHRWRPQNFTYLLGFRQHEQGNNAVEIPQFDPLVAEAERKIAKLALSVGKN